jgi:hypothetical protein
MPADQPYQPASDPLATLKLAAAWLFVGIPLAWGVYRVVVTSLPLFK